MKFLSKPISSPSRTDKFPTPLMMRFLRSNVGSRSRGRSRSSPMFILRTKKNAAVINNDIQQEPSSPKVTCIGQVRARRSSKSKSLNSKRTSRSTTPPSKHVPPNLCCCSCSSSCCGCFPTTQFCCHFSPVLRKPRSFCRLFRKWVSFFRFGYCKKIDTREDSSSRVESIQRGQTYVNSVSKDSDIEENKENVGESKQDFIESSSSPPKNALLLTRCRSAPYRSSSLAGRFWGSPLGTSETETDTLKSELQEPPEPGEESTERRPISPNCGNEAVESINSISREESEELDSSSNGKTKEGNFEDLRAIGGPGGGSILPLLLTRCKSEPARTGERLNPEVNFWRQRRSDTTESCLQENINCG